MILLLQIRLAALVLLLRAVRPSFAAVIDDGRYAGSPNSSDDTTTFDKRDAPSPHVARSLPLPSGIPLKLLPIGDSITVGVASTDLNGYRLTLENSIKGTGQSVDFIGTQTSGSNNPDNQEEGYGGKRINEILTYLQGDGILNQQPNLVLIHAGTNDNDFETKDSNGNTIESYADAPARLEKLLDYVLCHAPNAVVLVAELINNEYNQSQTDFFNTQVPVVVGQRYMAGYKIRAIDMTSVGGDDLYDDLHPTDAGYVKLADLWFAAITNVPDSWWSFSKPRNTTSGGTTETCVRGQTYFSPADGENGTIAEGYHVQGDTPEPPSPPATRNTFSPGWGASTTLGIGVGRAGSGVQFADIDGDGMADYLWVDNTTSSVRAWLNQGGKWQAVNGGDLMAFGTGKPGYVEFADLDGDGKAEYIIFADGKFNVWHNGGPNGDIWNWDPWDAAADYLFIPVNNSGPFHLIADLDGSGTADMATLKSDGAIDCYIADGWLADPPFWTLISAVAIFQPIMWLVDIDGDRRADYLSVAADGSVKGWLNKPKNSDGGGIAWAQIGDGTTGSVALGAGLGPTVRFADVDGDGLVDYLVIDDDNGAVQAHRNIGSYHDASGSTGIGGYGAAVRLADLNGDGRDDYLSVAANTETRALFNGGASGDRWIWNDQGIVAIGNSTFTRSEIYFADMNGDGRDDYLVVDEQGTVRCYLNVAFEQYSDQGVIAIGVGGDRQGVRFADIDGDGRDDYIYLDHKGAATIWLNTGPGLGVWTAMNDGESAAIGVGANREDVQFADIDGDGRADYLWIHPGNGATEVWYNGGPLVWIAGGQIAGGVGYPGQNIRFARIGTSGRADYAGIEESTGALTVWLNLCAEVNGTIGTPTTGVNATCGSPPLPTQTAPEPTSDAAAAAYIWANAPDFESDEVEPYPSLKNADGSNISVSNIRGTRIYGFSGCGGSKSSRTQAVRNAFKAFQTLAGNAALYKNIDWASLAAIQFWGPNEGDYALRQDTRNEITQIFKQAQQTHGYWWAIKPVPWEYYKFLWIEIRCSDGKSGESSTDPTNACGDAIPNDGKCPGGRPPSGGQTSQEVFAFADPAGRYSRITFCEKFFQLNDFDVATQNAQRLSAAKQLDLNNWDNTARVFFHEVTHLDYFMNAPGKNPEVSDLEIQIRQDKKVDWYGAYGPHYAKFLALWQWPDNDPNEDPTAFQGYFPQRNADSFAYFALAKYVEKLTGAYPRYPAPASNRKVLAEPRNMYTGLRPESLPPLNGTTDGSSAGPAIAGDDGITESEDYFPSIPGCGDKDPNSG